jgi:hypothetical protein
MRTGAVVVTGPALVAAPGLSIRFITSSLGQKDGPAQQTICCCSGHSTWELLPRSPYSARLGLSLPD